MAVRDTKAGLVLRRILECPCSSNNHQHGPPTAITNAPASALTSTEAFAREPDVEEVL